MQTINVTVEVTDGVDPQAIVDAINELTTGPSWDSRSQGDDAGYYLGVTKGTPAHAVAGEIYVPAVPGVEVRVGRVTLVK
jgi:hypothetical protein